MMCFLVSAFGQGTNNDFDYDQADFNMLFKEMGFSVFKFPVKQERNEILDIVIEEYRNGSLHESQSAIAKAKKQFEDIGVDILPYVRPKMSENQTDSIYLTRFYFEKQDTSLSVKFSSHGLSMPLDFEVANLNVGSVRARFSTKEAIDEHGYLQVDGEETLIYFYGNLEEDKTLWCPAGLSKEQLIKKFDYVVFVDLRDYKE